MFIKFLGLKLPGHYKRLGLAVVVSTSVLLVANTAKADYVINKGISGDINNFLYEGTRDGIEALASAGVKAVTAQILNTLGQSLLASYSPALAELFFGGPSELDRVVETLTGVIREGDADQVARLRSILGEVMTQYDVDITSVLESSNNILAPVLEMNSAFQRVQAMNLAGSVMIRVDDARERVQRYVLRDASPEVTYRRLALLPTHAALSQLTILTSRLFWGAVAINEAFAESGGDGGPEFLAWSAALTSTDLRDIESRNPGFNTIKNKVHVDTLNFYESLSRLTPIENYVSHKTTPLVSHMVQFVGNAEMYDNADVTREQASWRTVGTSTTLLDGIRWYYYIDIPRADCLDGYAWNALVPTSVVPWREIATSAAASHCNRHWMVDLNLVSSGWPNTQLASFDQFGVWFENPQEAYTLHQQLVVGDLLRNVYGPSSLILDQYYWDQYGAVRPDNRWDRVFRRYDRQVSMLGSVDGYTDGISFRAIVEAVELIEEYGGNDMNLGLASWFEAIKTVLDDYGQAERVLRAALEAQTNVDWLYQPPRLSARQIRRVLTGPESFAINFASETNVSRISTALVPQIRKRTLAKFTSLL